MWTLWNVLVVWKGTAICLGGIYDANVKFLDFCFGSSPPGMFLGKAVLKICRKFTEEQP